LSELFCVVWLIATWIVYKLPCVPIARPTGWLCLPRYLCDVGSTILLLLVIFYPYHFRLSVILEACRVRGFLFCCFFVVCSVHVFA
jgi:hypothetical protein